MLTKWVTSVNEGAETKPYLDMKFKLGDNVLGNLIDGYENTAEGELHFTNAKVYKVDGSLEVKDNNETSLQTNIQGDTQFIIVQEGGKKRRRKTAKNARKTNKRMKKRKSNRRR
jgi:hypothetical protein